MGFVLGRRQLEGNRGSRKVSYLKASNSKSAISNSRYRKEKTEAKFVAHHYTLPLDPPRYFFRGLQFFQNGRALSRVELTLQNSLSLTNWHGIHFNYFVLSQVIKWSTLDGGCTDFSRVLKLRNRKWGPTGTRWGPNGDPKTEKGPHGDPGTQMGTHLGAMGDQLTGWGGSSRKQN